MIYLTTSLVATCSVAALATNIHWREPQEQMDREFQEQKIQKQEYGYNGLGLEFEEQMDRELQERGQETDPQQDIGPYFKVGTLAMSAGQIKQMAVAKDDFGYAFLHRVLATIATKKLYA
ncbi:MAG: hypothetical protein LQ342_004271 [Letrouitia transgressa]|nr:MAG: hypothetical protein LQ342_004271 [Letrouitia transgressa]